LKSALEGKRGVSLITEEINEISLYQFSRMSRRGELTSTPQVNSRNHIKELKITEWK
jgi:hypothetical protein